MIGSISFQWYAFYGTRTLARVQSILVQLVFDHSLRVRLAADPCQPDTKDASAQTSDSSADDVQGSNDRTQGPSRQVNLIGKVNTLVTVDVGNVGDAKFVFMYGSLLKVFSKKSRRAVLSPHFISHTNHS